jgi:hypothetical protein
MNVDPIIKEKLGFNKNDFDDTVLINIREKKKIACKPCWWLKYCPCEPAVEDFPLLPPTIDDAISYNEYFQ